MLVYPALWIAIAAIHFVLLPTAWQLSVKEAALDSFVHNGLFVVIGAGLWFWTKYTSLYKSTFFEALAKHVVGCALSVALWIFASNQVLHSLMPENNGYLSFLDNSVVIRAISGVFLYLLMTGLFYLIAAYRELDENRNRENALKSLLHDAEINMLRSQIKPHFLFNTLNSINTLIISQPALAREMVLKLSEFMRHSLKQKEEALCTLKEELSHVRLYLDIEKVRFLDRLRINETIDDDCLEAKLPAMIMQPLVENAVKHGVYEMTEDVNIKLKASIKNNSLRIEVSNSYDAGHKAAKGTGTGLSNIARRLQLLYGRADLLEIEKSNGTFTVTLHIPQ